MMLVPAGVRVHIALGVTDLRYGLDGLAMLVQEVVPSIYSICPTDRGFLQELAVRVRIARID